MVVKGSTIVTLEERDAIFSALSLWLPAVARDQRFRLLCPVPLRDAPQAEAPWVRLRAPLRQVRPNDLREDAGDFVMGWLFWATWANYWWQRTMDARNHSSLREILHRNVEAQFVVAAPHWHDARWFAGMFR